MAKEEVNVNNTNDLAAAIAAALIPVIQEMKKPTELEQKKLDEERKRQELAARRRITAAVQEQQAREARKRNCSHTKSDGKHSWVGVGNSDGFWRAHCLQCQTVLPPIIMTNDQLTNGINLNEYNVTLEQLEDWAAQSAAKYEDMILKKKEQQDAAIAAVVGA